MHHISTQWQQRHKRQWCNRLNCSLWFKFPTRPRSSFRKFAMVQLGVGRRASADLCNFFKQGQFRPARAAQQPTSSLFNSVQEGRERGVQSCATSQAKRKANFGQQKIGSTFFGEQATAKKTARTPTLAADCC
jgi:hypothetical protein